MKCHEIKRSSQKERFQYKTTRTLINTRSRLIWTIQPGDIQTKSNYDVTVAEFCDQNSSRYKQTVLENTNLLASRYLIHRTIQFDAVLNDLCFASYQKYSRRVSSPLLIFLFVYNWNHYPDFLNYTLLIP